MHFALATTQGGRPTTVTTAAMSNDGPRTSAVPAPTSYLPHAVPSTSKGVGATSADASTGPDADDHTAGGSQITMEDCDDISSENEYQKSGSTFTMALGHYFFERNLIETPNNYLPSKPVIDYVNLKFVENNFRTLGLDEMFDKNNIMRAEIEFESFEVWFSHLKNYAPDREYIRDLRLPLFCHLYLNLYAPRNHARLQAFLKTFKYIFASGIGAIYLEELRNVTDALNLSPRLEYFRRNKFVYGVSPMFVNNLYDFFQINFMLQVVFQEWIDINYITYEDPRIVFDEPGTSNQERVNNLDKANAPKVNNNVNPFRTELCKKTLNSSQNQNNNRKVNNSENDFYNNRRPSTSKDFVGSSSGSSFQASNCRKLANNCVEDQQKQDTNSELDESTDYSEQSSTQNRYLEPRSRRSKKSTENSEQSSTEDHYLEPRSRRSKKSTENSEQSSTEDYYLEPRSRRSKKSTENSEQSSTEDHYLKPKSKRLKKKNIKRKHIRHDRDRPSSYERESRRLKKFCVEKNDDTSLQKRSKSHQENEKLSEAHGEGQSLSNQKEVKEERIILRISRKSNRLHVISSNERKEPNDPENPNLEKSNEEQISNKGKKSRKHRKKHKLRRKKKSTSDNNLHESSNDTSNKDEQLRKKIKSSNRRKSTSDQNLSRSCEKSSEISDDDYKEKKCKRQKKSSGSQSTNDDNNMQMSESLSEVSDSEQKKYKRQKNSGRCKSTNDDNNTQMNESLSEVSDGEKKKYRQQKKIGKSKSISDVNLHTTNNDVKKQKRQNKRSKTKSTSDDNNRMSEISSDEQTFQKPQKKKKLRGKEKCDHNIDYSRLCGSSSEDQESPNKDRENHKSNARRKYECINSNTSLSESYSEGDSLEDSSSLYSSSCDEELSLRKYMRNIKKSTQYLRYDTSRYMKPIKVTKINLKTLDEDLYLCLSRKIVLKNCSKVSCSFLTSDQNLVVAGSVDALIYLWERDNESVSKESHDVLHTIGNINPSNFASSVQGNNLVEYLDKSKAFILRGHGGSIFDLAELPSAKILLSASDDKTYRVWDLRTKQCVEIFDEHEHRTWCIAASPYSLQVATGSCEGTSCLWFLNYKRPLRMFVGHLDDILVLKFHPNQVFLATGSSDKTVRVFEITTGDCHRVLMGHTDYITCLEFNTENFNCLASAAGNGEIIVWDVPSGEIVWRIGVGKVFFSDLVWITKDVLLASLTTGVVLKCDTTLNYIDSSCKVNGFETPFYRLFSLQIINNIVYTIGIPDKSGGLKPLSKRTKEKALQMKSGQQKSQKEPSPLSKLFFPQHIIDNGNSMTPLRGLSLSTPIPTCDFEYQINTNDQLNKSTLPNFLSMNLKSSPFHLTADEISKLSSEYQSKNIRLIPASDITNNLKNAYLLPIQQNIRTSNANSINTHSTNVQLPSTSKSQKLNKTQVPPKSKITTAKQHNFGNSSLKMHTSIQHMQIKTTIAQEQLHLDDHKDTDMLVQQYLQTPSTSTHKQQTSNLLQVTRPGMSSPLLQNSIVQQDQKMQLQHGTGSNSNVAGTNVQQQQLLQQSRSNTNLTKGNVQQRLSSQTNNRSSNVTKRPSPRQSPNKSSSLDDTGTSKHTRMQ